MCFIWSSGRLRNRRGEDHQVGRLERFEAGDVVVAVRVDRAVLGSTAKSTVHLNPCRSGEDLGQLRQGLLGAVLLVAADEDDVLALAGPRSPSKTSQGSSARARCGRQRRRWRARPPVRRGGIGAWPRYLVRVSGCRSCRVGGPHLTGGRCDFESARCATSRPPAGSALASAVSGGTLGKPRARARPPDPQELPRVNPQVVRDLLPAPRRNAPGRRDHGRGRGEDPGPPVRRQDARRLEEGRRRGDVRVEGGTIVGEVGPGANTFLRTEKTYGDFVLKLDFKLDMPGNSGIQFRSHQQEDGNGRVFGYQCEIDPLAPRLVGRDLRRGPARLALSARRPPRGAEGASSLTSWNAVVIEARGPRLRTRLNGVPCADLLDTPDLEGFIALQVHAGKAGQIRWKNIRLKDLGRSAMDAALGRQDARRLEEDRRRHLDDRGRRDPRHVRRAASAARPADHRARPTAISPSGSSSSDKKGNSGLYFRCEEGGSRGRARPPGRDRRRRGRRRPVRDRRPGLGRPGPTAETERQEVPSRSRRTTAGTSSRSSPSATGSSSTSTARRRPRSATRRAASEGRIALQLHGGQDMDVAFKDIEILKNLLRG